MPFHSITDQFDSILTVYSDHGQSLDTKLLLMGKFH